MPRRSLVKARGPTSELLNEGCQIETLATTATKQKNTNIAMIKAIHVRFNDRRRRWATRNKYTLNSESLRFLSLRALHLFHGALIPQQCLGILCLRRVAFHEHSLDVIQ